MDPDWQELGKQRYLQEGDATRVQLVGEITSEELRALFALFWTQHLRCGQVVVLLDCTQVTAMGPQARRLLPELRRTYPIPGVTLVYGASWAIRTLGTLLSNSARLLGRNRSASQMLFFASAAAADQWLAQYRR